MRPRAYLCISYLVDQIMCNYDDQMRTNYSGQIRVIKYLAFNWIYKCGRILHQAKEFAFSFLSFLQYLPFSPELLHPRSRFEYHDKCLLQRYYNTQNDCNASWIYFFICSYLSPFRFADGVTKYSHLICIWPFDGFVYWTY